MVRQIFGLILCILISQTIYCMEEEISNTRKFWLNSVHSEFPAIAIIDYCRADNVEEFIKIVEEDNQLLNIPQCDAHNALEIACVNGSKKILKYLLENWVYTPVEIKHALVLANKNRRNACVEIINQFIEINKIDPSEEQLEQDQYLSDPKSTDKIMQERQSNENFILSGKTLAIALSGLLVFFVLYKFFNGKAKSQKS